ncbi:hypothetical protein ADMFC3_00180 [Geovibrio sp. ADMFC3]
MLKVVYIDESVRDRSKFQRNFSDVFNIDTFHPEKEINLFIESIFSHSPDLIVTDFCLSDNAEQGDEPVSYNGGELIKHIQSYKLNFPCYVATAYEDDAIGNANPDSVYVKEDINNNQETKHKMIQRMEAKVTQYQKWLSEIKEQFDELIKKKEGEGLTAKEENTFFELDTLIEKAINGTTATSIIQKDTRNTQMLKDLISKANAILERI